MEVDGIVEISKRSEEIYGIKYDYYVGDVNSKVYKAVCYAKPYGEDFIIEKKYVLAIYKRWWERALKNYHMPDLLDIMENRKAMR